MNIYANDSGKMLANPDCKVKVIYIRHKHFWRPCLDARIASSELGDGMGTQAAGHLLLQQWLWDLPISALRNRVNKSDAAPALMQLSPASLGRKTFNKLTDEDGTSVLWEKKGAKSVLGCYIRSKLRPHRWEWASLLLREVFQGETSRVKGLEREPRLASPGNRKANVTGELSTRKRRVRNLERVVGVSILSGDGNDWIILSKRVTWPNGHVKKMALALVWITGYSESGRREAQEGAAAESTEHSLNQERSPGLIKGDGKARIYNVG